MKFRYDINAVRALAVTAVVLVWWLAGEAVCALGPEHAVTEGERVFNWTTRAEWINACQTG